MKAQLLGAVFVLAVLAALMFVTEDNPTASVPSQPTNSTTNDTAFKELKIN